MLFLNDPLTDIVCYSARFASLHTRAFFFAPNQAWTYPAPCAFVYSFIYRLTPLLGAHNVTHVYLLVCILLLGIVGCAFGLLLLRAGLEWKRAILFSSGILLVSWPIYFSIERGNIEVFLWPVLAVALAAYTLGRWDLAAIGIGFIAAFKIYPILLLGLFLPARRYRQMLEGVLVAGLTSLAGLRFLYHDVAYSGRYTLKGISKFVSLYSSVYMADAGGVDHSAWALFKYSLRNHPHLMASLVPKYTVLAGLLAAWFYFTHIWTLPRFNQLLALCSLMVLLPATSFDYTLQAMYIPFVWLCLATVRARMTGTPLRGTMSYFTAFGLLFGPLIFIRGRQFTINGQLKALVLFYLLYLSVRLPLPGADLFDRNRRIENRALPSTAIPS